MAKKPPLLTNNLNWIWSSLIIQELVDQGVTHFYISPGMRNAPLIAALENYKKHAHEQLFFDVVMDERSAAYRAIGHAKTTGNPAVIICTSGTALANYMPAVVECSKSRLPLIIISSDRPPELNYSDANQTIQQDYFFGRFTNTFVNLGTPSKSIPIKAIKTTLSNLVARSKKSGLAGPGPIHLNIPFREPIDGSFTKETLSPTIEQQLTSYRQSGTYYSESFSQTSPEALEQVIEKLKKSPKSLLVVGELPPWLNKKPIANVIKKLKLPIFLDVGSSLKYHFNLQDNQESNEYNPFPGPSFDHPEVFEEFIKNPPQLIIHVGGRLVARHYYELLSRQKIELITVNDSPEKEDPSHQTTLRLVARPDIFCQDLINKINQDSKFSDKAIAFKGINWKGFIHKKEEIIEKSPFSYPVISKTLIEIIPNKSSLYLGNSTVIRCFDSYASEKISKDIFIITHRGASGIEGFISAACGHSESKVFQNDHSPTTLVLGDVAAIHDLNAFLMLSQKSRPLIIIIINNFGGGIFTLLPMKESHLLLDTMTSPHHFHFESLSQGLEIPYQKVDNQDDFIEAYNLALERARGKENQTSVIEACFDNKNNMKVYKELKTIQI